MLGRLQRACNCCKQRTAVAVWFFLFFSPCAIACEIRRFFFSSERKKGLPHWLTWEKRTKSEEEKYKNAKTLCLLRDTVIVGTYVEYESLTDALTWSFSCSVPMDSMELELDKEEKTY